MTTTPQSLPPAPDVNRSGFPFQIAVEEFVRRRTSEPRWDVVAAELPWSGGFIDLIIRHGPLVGVVECKRVRGKSWVFLVERRDEPQATNLRVARFFSPLDPNNGRNGYVPRIDCIELSLAEQSPESRFCVVPKGEESAVKELESHARSLVDSCFEIADGPRIVHPVAEEVFVPILVTTAKLFTCTFNPSEVDVQSGHIRQSDLQEVDMVRFRKPLARELGNTGSMSAAGLGVLSKLLERTVVVVTPTGLNRLLFSGRVATVHEPGRQPRVIV